MADLRTDETGETEPWVAPATGNGRPTAASLIAELWQEREQSIARPPSTPLPPTTGGRPRRQRPAGDDGEGSATKAILGVVVVALLLGAGVGVFLNSQGIGTTSKGTYVRKADAVCGPANGPVAALVKPTSYPELAAAAGTLVTSTDAQLAGLGKVSAPGGVDGGRVGVMLAAMTQANSAGRSLQDAAGRADDAAAATAVNQLRTSSKEATTKAQELGMGACAIGLQPGVDVVVTGGAAVVKTAFVAKADTICRTGARELEAIRLPRGDTRDLVRYLNQGLPIIDRMLADVKALPVPPGDEATVAEITSGFDKVSAKTKEARDAAAANDRSRFLAAAEEETVLSTAVDAKLDAYGLTSCGSNFGSR